MNEKDIKNAIEKISPDEQSRQRMLNNILNPEKSRKTVVYKRLIPAAALVVMVCASFAIYGILSQNNKAAIDKGQNETFDNEIGGIGTDAIYENSDKTTDSDGIEMDIAMVYLLNFNGRVYTLPYQDKLDYLGYSSTVTSDQVGEKIAVSTDGTAVYQYVPAGCEAFVVAEKDGGYELYSFMSFESYNNNKDENASEYLKLYGADSAEDIAKIEVYGYYGDFKNASIKTYTDSATTAKFYKYFKDLKNNSDQYFAALFGNSSVTQDIGETSSYVIDYGDDAVTASAVQPDGIARSTSGANATDYGDYAFGGGAVAPDETAGQAGQSTSAYPGSAGNALANESVFRICLKNGNFMEFSYYPNIQFLSRFSVGGEFSEMLQNMG
ncbi:MAG: hypothetical protein PHV07_09765 [Oscillospiraceae bacterium]|nr:hypothetical protein [Oscillospiraceae bacterium]